MSTGRLWVAGALALSACPQRPLIDWEIALDDAPEGVFLSAWGADADDVWVVGGQPDEGAVMRGSGTSFDAFDLPAGTPLLNWVHGSAADDVWVGGIEGTLLHWDGAVWTDHDLGVDEAVWGVHAASRDEAWAVGGESSWGGTAAMAFAWDGSGWDPLTLPPALADAPNLFKVAEAGGTAWIAGVDGVAATIDGDVVTSVSTGTAQDLVTVDAANGPVVVVGGRNTGVVLEPAGDGLAVTTTARAGLQGVSVYADDRALVTGENGFSGIYHIDEDRLDEVLPITDAVLHGCFVAHDGALYAVGGNLFTAGDTFAGVLLTADKVRD